MDIADLGVMINKSPVAHKPNALELALVAATVDPKLARANPAKAVEIARLLISAAQEDIDRPFREECEEFYSDWEHGRELDRLFPDEERVSVSEAFDRWPSGYTSLGRFAAALLRANLSIAIPEKYSKEPGRVGVPIAFKEVTSKRAVDALAEWKKENEKKRNREAKKKAARKKLEKIARNSERKNGNAGRKNGKPNRKSVQADSKKRMRRRPR